MSVSISVREMDDVDWQAECMYFDLLKILRNLRLLDLELFTKADNYIDFEWEPKQ